MQAFRLRSMAGLEAEILSFGARLASLRVPTAAGPVEVVLGYPQAAGFLVDRGYLGAVIGRVSGRIARARCAFGGQEFRLEANAGEHHLHGGTPGLHGRHWQAERVDAQQLVLGAVLPAGESGYPGQLRVRLAFRVEALTLQVQMAATVDAVSPLSLTYHPYFNLGGPGAPLGEHRMEIAASRFLEVDAGLIPTGRQLPVTDTPLDFRRPARLGERLAQRHPQLALAGGFDHTYLLDPERAWDARVWHPRTDLSLRVRSDQPGLQFYTGQWLEPLAGAVWQAGDGLCLEPQGWPDAVNRPEFPSPWLRPGEWYRRQIRYEFATTELSDPFSGCYG
ncbi:MAG: aldose epimerase family protein [Gammaproteobacteria bacterium]